MTAAEGGRFDAVVSDLAIRKLDLKHLVETAPQINRDTIIWLLYQKVRLEGDGDVTRVRNSHYVHAQATFRNDDLMVRALLNGDHHLELRAACALAVSYQGAIAICERLANPCQKPLQCRLLRSNLAVAAYRGQGSIIRSLVAQGSRVDSWDDFLGPPLYAAAIFPGRVTIVAFLLKSKANPNVGGSLGTPLLVAMWNRDESVVQLLLQNSEVDPNQPDRQGFTALWWACFSGKSDIVRLLLDHKKTDPNLKCGGQTPLAAAAGRGHEMIVGWLLEREDVFIDLKNGTHCPLWCVAFAGQPHVLQLLLDKLEVSADDYGLHSKTLLCDVNPNYHDGKGDNPLWEAAKNGHADVAAVFEGHEDVVDVLLGCDALNPNLKGGWSESPLIVASTNGLTRIVAMLLQRTEININLVDCNHRTALSFASEKDHEAIVHLLLNRSDVDVGKVDQWGRTPLSWAGEKGHVEIVRLLLQHQPTLMNMQDADGNTCLIEAVRGGHLAVVELLLDFNADICLKDWKNRTALCWARQRRHQIIEAILARRREEHL
ncbi:uncharacterized protein N7473_011115 [Penicillium subrubescens]|nr:uncharacterized protein N7473_011115 [Penicillium subrubescens]KAJ5882681.1 hypothetical protein N7473_011115 [Penicillium subrubescens]